VLQTLFYIPAWLFESPWLWVWTIILFIAAAAQARQTGWSEALSAWGPPIVLLWVFSKFMIDQLVDYDIDPTDPEQIVPLGIAVRGYGMMMLLGIIAGIGLAIYRGEKEGLSSESIFSLAIHLILFGIIGARIFYVIQYWESFAVEPFPQRLISMVNMTKGGLVVLGSFFGATLGMFYWSWRRGVSVAKLADLVGPSFLVGLSLGRIGCLLNGCCFGGYCDIPALGVEFPAGSPPFIRQVEQGRLFGLLTQPLASERRAELDPADPRTERWLQVTDLQPNSVAASWGVAINDLVFIQFRTPTDRRIGVDKVLRSGTQGTNNPWTLILHRLGHPEQVIPWNEVPQRAQPIHPTQVYSSFNAIFLAILIWVLYRWRRFDGQSFATMIVLYGIARFILEIIRQDEAGQFGTDLTISQWGAILLVVSGLGLLIYGARFGRRLPDGQIRWQAR
jgi:phosphatidylglycerol:prolipoprotein diacylglycerol transferase